MASSHYDELKTRTESLVKNFMPATNPLGFYSPHEEDMMRALRMLIHAEVESYLETICARGLLDLDAAGRSATRVKHRFATWIGTAAAECRNAIATNNGVKENDIRKMFTPLGLTQDDYDQVSLLFLEKMNSFGKNRGDVAHQSAARATFSLNKKREEAVIRELMQHLERFDQILIQRRLIGFSL